MSTRLSALAVALILLGAGCWSAPSQDAAADASSAETPDTSMAPNLPPTDNADAAVPHEWTETRIPNRGIVFAPPEGYWVYFLEAANMFLLVPGEPPAPGSPDPRDELLDHAVASFTEVRTDPASVPTWEQFELVVAQLACPEVSMPDDPVSCPDTAATLASDAMGDMPWRAYSLPLRNTNTNASRGSRTFVMVRQSRESDFGLFFRVPDPANLAATLALVRSLKVE